MEKHEWLAEEFEARRSHLQTVAYRLLGSISEAEDAVQEAWLRLSHSDTSNIQNLSGWLTTVVARISLNMLRSRKSLSEESLETSMLEQSTRESNGDDPEQEVLLADSVGLALLIILDALSPAERIAFVLHDIFAVPFDEIARVVERSETATRQLASRARRRVRGRQIQETDLTSQQNVINAFLAASRAGNFEDLLTLLDPDVVYRADARAELLGASREVHGAQAVCRQIHTFLKFARFAKPALVNGSVGIAVAPYGQILLVTHLVITAGKIAQIHVMADTTTLSQIHLSILPD